MSQVIPTKIEKCKGAMLAAAIGDALGWPNEPRSKNRTKKPKVSSHFVEWTRSTNNPRWHDEQILPGEYSDDTQMTLSVARSIITGNWEKFFAERELPFWLNYERGGGGALLKAAKSCHDHQVQLWQSDYTRGYFNAGGNGATMRILPHVIAAARTSDISALMLDVIKDTLITHGHPRAFLGSTCYAYALNYLLRKDTLLEYGELVAAVIDGQKTWGANPDPDNFGDWLDKAHQHDEYDFFTEWENTRTHMLQQLEFIKGALKKGLILDDIKVLNELECFGKVNGAGDVAVLAAIYLTSKYANNPVLGIKIPAFSFGADTDTIASITGGLIGMLNGVDWIPEEWKIVQDYDCLVQMAELLLADDKKEATRAEVIEAKARNDSWEATPIGKMRLVSSSKIPNGKNGVVIINKWKTLLGQTLYTKLFQPNVTQIKTPRSDIQPQIPRPAAPYAHSHQYNLPKQTQVTPSVPRTTFQTVSAQKIKPQFILDEAGISMLLDNSKFKNNITIGKVLKIIQALLAAECTANIAKQFEVDSAMVDLIKLYVKD